MSLNFGHKSTHDTKIFLQKNEYKMAQSFEIILPTSNISDINKLFL